jgi:hypothetical protein
MDLGVIDKDEYRQYRYWQAFQRLLLPCAAGFSVAGALLEGADVRRLSLIVGGLLWVLFAVAAMTAWRVARHMVRELPASLQSLLLFSSETETEDTRGNGETARLTIKEAPAEP